jgi:hypothetical protein
VSLDVLSGDEAETILEQDLQTELVVDSTTDTLIEEASTDVLVEESTHTELLLEEGTVLIEQEQVAEVIVTAAEQGPPGPQGIQGEPGPSGASTVGGLGVALVDPQPGDVLVLQASLNWRNEHLLDGGNF